MLPQNTGRKWPRIVIRYAFAAAAVLLRPLQFGWMNEIALLNKAGNYGREIQLIEEVLARFPQVNEGPEGGLDSYLQDARKKLVSQSRPSSGPAMTPATQSMTQHR